MKIVLLNDTTLPVYRTELADLLLDAVTHGASVGYEMPLTHETAASYFHGLRTSLAEGERLLWIARDQQGIVGSVQLELCQKANGLNRAEVQKLLVHSRIRRQGIGRRLLSVLERTAFELNRGLLHLDTQAGSPAEAFYRTQGYRYLGEIPDYASAPDGCYHPTAIYYKRLFVANRMTHAMAS